MRMGVGGSVTYFLNHETMNIFAPNIYIYISFWATLYINNLYNAENLQIAGNNIVVFLNYTKTHFAVMKHG